MITKVTIITPAYALERLNDIKQLLDSVAVQSNQNLEMFLVVEKTPTLSESINQYIQEKGYSRIKVIINDGPVGASAARNAAIQQSQGDIIAFVDDDAVLHPAWVEELMKTFKDDSVIGVTGPILPLWQDVKMSWFPQEFYWIFSCSHNLYSEKTDVRNGYGTNLAFRREAFQYAGLFNPELGVKGRGRKGWREPGLEEPELCLRIKQGTGKRIIYNPAVQVQHKVYAYRMSTGFITKRSFWEGYGKALFKDKYRSLNTKENVLSIEYNLLRRILLHRFPQAIKLLFRHPRSAALQLCLILAVLTCVASGYCRYKIKSL